ncbi:hypothetical protein AHMF7605_14155 [Adhaeribacter arboris]|uniref:Uncharacterized protein n=1 Tax=Adhaeribacter arboris TaxID=2072846 RepID=A0A2T2YGB6_9BACT|nr:hypothetical protein AHMF7605_14155 [Adhaeribacter arboris]
MAWLFYRNRRQRYGSGAYFPNRNPTFFLPFSFCRPSWRLVRPPAFPGVLVRLPPLLLAGAALALNPLFGFAAQRYAPPFYFS